MIVRSLKALSSDRIQILFDDGTESTLPTDLILRHNLHAGAEFPADFLQQLAMESESLRARDRGLSLLSYRMHSAKELRDKLLRKGFEASAVENAIAWLKDKAWLDDSRFASELAISYLSMIGSVLIFCVGINLIWGKRIRVANMLPALIFAIAAAFLPIDI